MPQPNDWAHAIWGPLGWSTNVSEAAEPPVPPLETSLKDLEAQTMCVCVSVLKLIYLDELAICSF